jgi:hypothetical protein
MNNNSWMPKTAGILDIVAGGLSLLGLFMVGIGTMFFSVASSTTMPMIPGCPIGLSEMLLIFWVIAIPKGLLSILAIIGGVYALKKRIWGLALAGSIAAIFSSFILGVASLIFTIMGKDQFE